MDFASKMLPTRALQRQWRLGKRSVDRGVRLEGERPTERERARSDDRPSARPQLRRPMTKGNISNVPEKRTYKWRSWRSPLSDAVHRLRRSRVPKSMEEHSQENLGDDLKGFFYEGSF